ncbi:MAG: transcription repressor NadR [Alicyclobacillus herbarius]|uniref:transcription repressor NadR n=1 Tax=Alicyclobacillus herbarius TaxID=122960 RepID=UPI0004038B80|nr:transcription repressor NadR [Alicyclobacillus herbarius]MCL6633699.1 transcription repressor NadR [Alicyclobacillus herbarius]
MGERQDRQAQIVQILRDSRRPVTGSDLASMLGVTRQVVVHEIALLRAQGQEIVSTPRGYFLESRLGRPMRHVLAVNHPPELTRAELFTLVDYGIRVVDVLVEHPLYGELRGSLRLSSRRDVELFLRQVEESGATLLSSLTDGHHLHTVECEDESLLTEAIAELRRQGIEVHE